MGGYGGLVRTDFGQFALGVDVVVLKQLVMDDFHFRRMCWS